MSHASPHLLAVAERVRERLAGGAPALVALDFDGTLTEIVDDPAAPRLTADRRRILERIPSPGRRLAIVSGRSLADVRSRVGIEDAIYVGNHGLEIAGPGLSSGGEGSAAIADRLGALLPHLELPPGAFAEDKRLTATIHTRPREDHALHERVGRALAPAVDRAGFQLRPGKASWEIRPAESPDKGDALRALISRVPGTRASTTLYAGDDVTDEDAFRALPDGITVRVGDDETAPTAARFRLRSPDETYRFLEILASD